MSSTLSLKVASFSSAVTFGKDDASVATILKWFLADKIDPLLLDGLTQAQTNQFYLDSARDEIVRYVRQEARKNRLKELRDAANVDAQADADTAL